MKLFAALADKLGGVLEQSFSNRSITANFDSTIKVVDLKSSDGYPAYYALLPGNLEGRIEISRDESQDAHARLNYIAINTPALYERLTETAIDEQGNSTIKAKSIAEIRAVLLEAERAAPLPGASEVRKKLEDTKVVSE